MCEATTGIALTTWMMAASAASATAGVVAQKQAADAQTAANMRQAENSRIAQAENANQVNLARGQQTDAASQKINANNLALREAQATTVARAGPTGLSLDALLADMGNKGATYNESVNQNLQSTNMALDNQLVNVNRTAANEVNSLKAPTSPDYLGAALRIGGAYQTYKKGQ